MKRLRLSSRVGARLGLPILIISLTLSAADRKLEGTVFYKGGEPAANAAVQLEDRVTLSVVSRITDSDGRFRFLGLNPDREYIVRATKKGYWSKSHHLSRFSSKAVETVTLYLVPANK